MKRFFQITLGSAALLTAVATIAQSPADYSQESNAQLIAELKKEEARTARLEQEMAILDADRVAIRTAEHRKVMRSGPPIPGAAKFPSPIRKSSFHSMGEPPTDLEDLFRHPVSVTTSPWMGLRSAYDASDLLEQMSTMNEDLRLLQQRQQLEDVLASEGLALNRPILEISGGIEADGIWQDGWQSSSGMALPTAEIDLNAVASQWAGAFMSLAYDNSPASTGFREPKGDIFLKRGFANIGNLNAFPFYFTAGRFYMPFGAYSSNMVTPPLTLSLARVVNNGVLLGFYHDGFYASVYGYSGDMMVRGNNIVDQGGANLGYKGDYGPLNFDIGGGIISNIADSQGMQDTLQPQPALGFVFSGFGVPPIGPGAPSGVANFDNLRHRVTGANAHGKLAFGPLSFIGEYAGATQAFNPFDMTMNNGSAQPQALALEGDLAFHIFDKPSTLGLAWSKTWDAYALNLPADSVQAEFSISLWKDTVQEIEYRHDDNYPSGNIATGGTNPLTNLPVPLPVSTGGSRNMVLGQLGVYF